jgi:hypothetical protein
MDVLASLKVCVSRAALTEIETDVLTTNQDTTVSDTEMHSMMDVISVDTINISITLCLSKSMCLTS